MPHARKLGAVSLLALAIAASSGAARAGEIPKHGGTLEVATIFATLSALSWDHKDWPWKINHDAGGIYEQLLVADLSKGTRAGGKHAFNADAWIPTDAIKGELAESWEVQKEPLAVVFKLKKGIMFPAKPGVMEARELTADDVVFSYYYRHNSPPRAAGHQRRVQQGRGARPLHGRLPYEEVRGRLAVSPRLRLQLLDHAEGSRRRRRRRLEERERHRPVHAHRLRSRQLAHLQQAARLLGQGEDQRGGVQAAVRRQGRLSHHPGRLDPRHRVPHRQARHHGVCRLGKHGFAEEFEPQIKWKQWVSFYGTMMVLRTDQKPFDDIRVRRALNMAVNKEEIVKTYYNGNAELFAYPMHPAYEGYYEPLSAMPDSVKELFTYNPEKAKKLLAEAGYPNGFTFKVQVSARNSRHRPAAAGRGLSRTGRRQDRDPAAGIRGFLSAMSTKTHAAGYFMNIGHSNPLIAHPQELRQRPALEPVDVSRSGVRQEDGDGRSGAGRGQAQGPDPRTDAAKSSTRRRISGCRPRKATPPGGHG